MTTPLKPSVLTTREYGAIMRLGHLYVSGLCRAGKIAGAVKVHRDWLIPLSSVPEQCRPAPPVEDSRDHQRRAEAAADALAAL